MVAKEKIEDKKNKKRKIFDWILNILLIVLLIIGIYLFLAKIFGNSPTEFQLILWLFGFFTTLIAKVYILLYSLNREVGELKIDIKSSFQKIKMDINEIKQNIYKVKK